MDSPHQALVGRRIAFIAAVAIISVWANYEASKDVEIVVINGVGLDTPLGRRISLLLVSDDSATRAVLRAARLSRRRLYAAADPVKPVRRITVRLTSTAAAAPNFTSALAEVSVERRPGDEYAVAVALGVGGERWEKGEVVGAIERGWRGCGCGTAALRRRWWREWRRWWWAAAAAAAEGRGGSCWGVVRGGGGGSSDG
ncbi:hypothetical protein Sjap_000719 [Stephania japonica]|uniref:Uncharacterized protein n=1 Tax=Stephania japonica TaxID=461633 RepID=A0AAP0KKW6_9MAGN